MRIFVLSSICSSEPSGKFLLKALSASFQGLAIDLKTFLELPESGLNDLNRVIILQSGDLSVGLLADRIVGADRLPLADLHASPPRGVAAHAGCVRGVTGAGLVVLDAERLINDPGLALDDEGAA